MFKIDVSFFDKSKKEISFLDSSIFHQELPLGPLKIDMLLGWVHPLNDIISVNNHKKVFAYQACYRIATQVHNKGVIKQI